MRYIFGDNYRLHVSIGSSDFKYRYVRHMHRNYPYVYSS